MTPHDQLIRHDPDQGHYGDCYRTCVAVILNLHPSEVPHAWHGGKWDTGPLQAFLAARGLGLSCWAWTADGLSLTDMLNLAEGNSPGQPMILSGRSALGCNHSVVIMGGEIVCDPSGNGIVGPLDSNQWQVELISVGRHWPSASPVEAQVAA